MDIQFQPFDSAMQRFIRPNDVFRIYLSKDNYDPVVLSGSDVIKIIGIHMCQADVTLSLAQRIAGTDGRRGLDSPRRLLGQHKPLKTLPTSPHQ